MSYPEVDFPTIIKGYVVGDKLRLEALDGSDKILTPLDAGRFGKSLSYCDGAFHMKNFGPISVDGKMWGVTHLQKYSKKGSLRVSPDCYHWWYSFRQQAQEKDGSWIPGTEKVLYFRRPFSWRWQPPEVEKWVWTKGYIGLHFD